MNLELNLVCVFNKKENTKQYFAVNDKHYDAMLASGDIDGYEWKWLGNVIIEEQILFEEGFREYGA